MPRASPRRQALEFVHDKPPVKTLSKHKKTTFATANISRLKLGPLRNIILEHSPFKKMGGKGSMTKLMRVGIVWCTNSLNLQFFTSSTRHTFEYSITYSIYLIIFVYFIISMIYVYYTHVHIIRETIQIDIVVRTAHGQWWALSQLPPRPPAASASWMRPESGMLVFLMQCNHIYMYTSFIVYDIDWRQRLRKFHRNKYGYLP